MCRGLKLSRRWRKPAGVTNEKGRKPLKKIYEENIKLWSEDGEEIYRRRRRRRTSKKLKKTPDLLICCRNRGKRRRRKAFVKKEEKAKKWRRIAAKAESLAKIESSEESAAGGAAQRKAGAKSWRAGGIGEMALLARHKWNNAINQHINSVISEISASVINVMQ